MQSYVCRSLSRMATACLVAGAGILFAGAAIATERYPAKPVKIIIPFTPGGSIDTVGRLVANQLQKQLGVTFIVENRPGGSGTIGAKAVASAPADGYTLLFNASSQVYMPEIVNTPPYNAVKDFSPIAQIGNVPLVVVTGKDAPYRNLRELLHDAQKNPDRLTWATSGYGTTSHLSEEIIRHRAGVKMDIVNYKGAGPQLVDVMGGFVTAAVSPMPGSYPHVKSGKLKPLAVTSKTRLPQLPDVPTVSESGIDGFEMTSWYGLWGPGKLPPDIVKLLAAETAKAIRTPELQVKFKEISFEVVDSTPEKFAGEIADEIARISTIARQANIKIDF